MEDAAGDPVATFMEITGAERELAKQYVRNAQGDVDVAVAQFFEDQEPDDGRPGPGVPAPPAAQGDDNADLVDSILGDAKKMSRDEGESDSKGAGKGTSKGAGKGSPSGKGRTVAIVFFADGFMVDDDPPKQEEAEPEQPAEAPAPRRTGMMSLNDLKKASKGSRAPMARVPKLKPLRSYDNPENKVFLDTIKAGRLPKELQLRDEAGEPIPVSIGIEDVRPKTYEELESVIKQMEKMKLEEERESGQSSAKPTAPALFAGAGQTLAGSSSSSDTGAPTGAVGSSGAGADPALVALVNEGPAPVADESKPLTTMQLRMSTGARVKVRLNLDHTVGDIWRLVASNMGADAFKAASGHQLTAGFPPKPLLDPKVSIAAADLSNAAISHTCK